MADLAAEWEQAEPLQADWDSAEPVASGPEFMVSHGPEPVFTPPEPQKTEKLRALDLGAQRGMAAVPGLLGLDRAKVAAASRYAYDRVFGDSGVVAPPSFGEFEGAERAEEQAAERDRPILTALGIGAGAAPLSAAAPVAMPAGAGLGARVAAAGTTAALQSAAVEGGVTSGLPVDERLKRMAIAAVAGKALGSLAPAAGPGLSRAELTAAAPAETAAARSRAVGAGSSASAAGAEGGSAAAQNVTEITVAPPKRSLVSRILKEPDPIPEAQYLRERGVPLTRGLDDPRSGFAQVEISSQSLEGIGPRIRQQRSNALSGAMDLAFNEARPPGSKPLQLAGNVNEKFATLDAAWDAAYGVVKESAGEVYPAVHNAGRGARLQSTANQPGAIAQAINSPDILASDGARTVVTRFVENQLTKLPPAKGAAGRVSAADLLDVRSSIRKAARQMTRQQKHEEAELLRAAEEQVTAALDSQLPPDVAQALRGLDGKYRTFKAVEDAVVRAGDQPQGITPSQLASSIKSVESSRNAYARGGRSPRSAQGAPEDYVYHVTPRENVDAITAEGLRPDAPKLAEGGPHGDTRAVFLGEADTLPTYRDLYGEDAAVLRVRRDAAGDLAPDEFSEGTSWMTTRGIPPSRIEVQATDGSWAPLAREAGGDELRTLSKAIRTVFDESASPPTGARLLSVAPKWARESMVGPTIYLRNASSIGAQGGQAGSVATASARSGASVSSRLTRLLSSNPAALGPFGETLKAIDAKAGPSGLAAAHYVLSHSSPEYRARFVTAVGGESEQDERAGQ
jgi:hypothetical protein